MSKVLMQHRRLKINEVHDVATGQKALKKINHIIRQLLKRSSLHPSNYAPHKRLKLYQVMKYQIEQAIKYHVSNFYSNTSCPNCQGQGCLVCDDYGCI